LERLGAKLCRLESTRSRRQAILYQFLLDWSDLEKEVEELGTYLTLSVDLNTADEGANDLLVHFNQVTKPKITIANAELRNKVLAVPNPDRSQRSHSGSQADAERLGGFPAGKRFLEAEQHIWFRDIRG